MKIAIFVSTFPKLSETFIINEIKEFEKLGIDYKIFSMTKPTENILNIGYSDDKIMEKVQYIDIPKDKKEKIIRLIRIILKNPFLVFRCVDILKYRKRTLGLAVLYISNELIKLKENYDIWYCHFGNSAEMLSDVANKIGYKGKIAAVFHGYDISAYVKKRKNKSFITLKKRGDIFLPTCGYWKDKLVEFGFDNVKIVTHYMGIDVGYFAFKKRDRTNNTFRILSIGRLVEKKGFFYSIKAVQLLIDKGYNIEYRIIGEGPLLKELQNEAEKLLEKNQICFLGARTSEQVKEELYKSDILIHPSVTADNGDMESMPLSIKEACATGTLVVATKHSGIPEIIIDGKTGFLAEEKDVNGLADKIEEAMKCNYDLISDNARKLVEEKYNVKICIDRLLEVFRKNI